MAEEWRDDRGLVLQGLQELRRKIDQTDDRLIGLVQSFYDLKTDVRLTAVELNTVKRIVYGAVALALGTLAAQIVGLVIKK